MESEYFWFVYAWYILFFKSVFVNEQRITIALLFRFLKESNNVQLKKSSKR